MINYAILEVKKEPLTSDGGCRKVYFKARLKNAYAIDENGNKSDVYEATFRSATEYNRFRELCRMDGVFSIGYESHYIRYKQWFMDRKKGSWVTKERVYHPDFIVNGGCLLEVKGTLTGAAEIVLTESGKIWSTAKAKYQAIKRSNKNLKLHFLHNDGATVTESGEDMDKWLKRIGFDGASYIKKGWLSDVLYSGVVRSKGWILQEV